MAILKASSINPNNIALDNRQPFTISWKNQGDRNYFYQITIYKNSDSTLVYDTGKVPSLNTFHIISSNTLTNGIQYKYKITLWNQVDESSITDWILIKASSVPIASFTNVNANGTIYNSSYLFQGNYTQTELVSIKAWNMILYDSYNNVVANTGLQYDPIIEYEFSGLNNNSKYNIELQVRSQDDLIATTGKVLFNVEYAVPSSSINLQADMIREKAGVALEWKVTQIIGSIISGTISFQDNEYIDLTNGVVAFQDGMPNFQNFNLKLWIKWTDLENTISVVNASTFLGAIPVSIKHNTTEILRLKSPLGDIWVNWVYENDTTGRFYIYKNFYNTSYHVQSESISPINNNTVYLGIDFNGLLIDAHTKIL